MAVGGEFDLGDLDAILSAVVESFDLTLPGQDQSLGRDLAVRAAHQIQDRSNSGDDPDGNEWRPNERRYAAYKLKRYQVDRPGELGGQMLSLTSVLGNPTVTPDSVEMAYGTGQAPQRSTSRGGTELKPHELKATDRQKAEWFEDGGREFYALSEEDCDALAELAGEALDRHLKALGF